MQDIDRIDLAAFVSGDREGAKNLVSRFSTPLLNHANYMLGGDRARAEDMVQDAFVKLWQKAGKLVASDAPLYLKAWLFRVVTNQVLDLKRRPKWDDDKVLEDMDDGQLSQQTQAEHKERAVFAMSLVGRLPERQRAAILMAHFEDMGQAEIARTLDITVDATESLLARARKSMRDWALNMKEAI